jgi:hypothetical protein
MQKDTLFVSYSRRDKRFVERLVKDLRSAHYKVWLDTEDLTPGTSKWEKAIRGALTERTITY